MKTLFIIINVLVAAALVGAGALIHRIYAYIFVLICSHLANLQKLADYFLFLHHKTYAIWQKILK